MPKTRGQSIFFTAVTAWIMVYIMTLYNTVVSQVAFASIIGVYHGYGFTSQFLPNYLVTYCRNFIMALPVQLFIAGPLARLIFRSIFVKKEA